jgi:hypothetical protein
MNYFNAVQTNRLKTPSVPTGQYLRRKVEVFGAKWLWFRFYVLRVSGYTSPP